MAGAGKRVFVLGAGFTKAFLPEAPLIIDDFGTNKLLGKFSAYPHVLRLLQLETQAAQKEAPAGSQCAASRSCVNLERLMTRVSGGMPYDRAVQEQHALLVSELKRALVERIASARQAVYHRSELVAFARICLRQRISCITFNYDDTLDEALFVATRTWDTDRHGPLGEGWHPNGGYAFFCRPAASSVASDVEDMVRTSMVLLKLHGSVNWHAKLGAPKPYVIDAIMHLQDWDPDDYGARFSEAAEFHLETEPFIVPPVLSKSELVNEPLLKLVWRRAYEELQAADEVWLVGYSLPVTDIGGKFLFAEAVKPSTHVFAASLKCAPQAQDELRCAYRSLFPQMTNDDFVFDGAMSWAKRLVEAELPGAWPGDDSTFTN